MTRNLHERRKSIIVPLNPEEKIEIRFYAEDKSVITSQWNLTTEELYALLNGYMLNIRQLGQKK